MGRPRLRPRVSLAIYLSTHTCVNRHLAICGNGVLLCPQLRSWGCPPRASGSSGLPDHLIYSGIGVLTLKRKRPASTLNTSTRHTELNGIRTRKRSSRMPADTSARMYGITSGVVRRNTPLPLKLSHVPSPRELSIVPRTPLGHLRVTLGCRSEANYPETTALARFAATGGSIWDRKTTCLHGTARLYDSMIRCAVGGWLVITPYALCCIYYPHTRLNHGNTFTRKSDVA